MKQITIQPQQDLVLLEGGAFYGSIEAARQEQPQWWAKHGEHQVQPHTLLIYVPANASLTATLSLPTEGGHLWVVLDRHSSLQLLSIENVASLHALYHVGEGASLAIVGIEAEGKSSHIHEHVVQEAHSRVQAFHFALNTQEQTRHFAVDLQGQGADCSIYGFKLARQEQRLNTTLAVNHRVPHCTSSQLVKSVAADKAQVRFTGRILVDKDAQKTAAFQTNKNILLSATAYVHAEPQLEIYADDVKCSHGSTVGQLDATALFYLRSRGIAEEQARQLLLQGFAEDIVQALPNAEWQEKVGEVLERELGRML